MIGRSQLVAMAVVYTAIVAVAISLANVSGGVVFGIAAAWFSIGRAWHRLPTQAAPVRRQKWGRQTPSPSPSPAATPLPPLGGEDGRGEVAP